MLFLFFTLQNEFYKIVSVSHSFNVFNSYFRKCFLRTRGGNFTHTPHNLQTFCAHEKMLKLNDPLTFFCNKPWYVSLCKINSKIPIIMLKPNGKTISCELHFASSIKSHWFWDPDHWGCITNLSFLSETIYNLLL